MSYYPILDHAPRGRDEARTGNFGSAATTSMTANEFDAQLVCQPPPVDSTSWVETRRPLWCAGKVPQASSTGLECG